MISSQLQALQKFPWLVQVSSTYPDFTNHKERRTSHCRFLKCPQHQSQSQRQPTAVRLVATSTSPTVSQRQPISSSFRICAGGRLLSRNCSNSRSHRFSSNSLIATIIFLSVLTHNEDIEKLKSYFIGRDVGVIMELPLEEIS